MLNRGDKICLFYDDGDGLVEAHGYQVIEYDNGLLKVFRPGNQSEIANLIPATGEASIPEIFNLRSTNFLKVEINAYAEET